MDLPIVLILILFAGAAVYFALRYRTEIAEEIEDLLDGDEPKTSAEPPARDREEQQQQQQQQEAPPPEPLRQSQQSEPPPDEAGAEPDEYLPTSEPPDEVAPPPTTPAPKEPVQTLPAPAPIAPADPWDSETDDEPAAPAGPTRGGETAPTPTPAAPGSAIVPDLVKFSAYYPRETAPQVWQPLAAYIFRQSAANEVIKDVGNVLGARASEFRRLDDTARVAVQEGAMVTAVPTLPGFQINPPQITLGFYEAMHRFDFKVRATSAPVDQAVNGTLTFSVEGVIVSELPLSIFIGHSVGEALTGAITRPVYQAIFCSYSHKDTQIVEKVEKAYKALGLTYLRDVTTLRSGQDWNDELMRLIDKADIFQLFWSESAAQSQFVRQEWEYALKMKREIRPVYWSQPMAPVPDALNAIHFAYTPDLVQ
jgi:outer membrane biosynthesis protein TonB